MDSSYYSFHFESNCTLVINYFRFDKYKIACWQNFTLVVWFQPFFFLVASSDDHNNRHNIVPVALSCNHFYSKKRCQKKQESWRHLQKKINKIMNENSLKIYAKHVFAIVTAVHSVWKLIIKVSLWIFTPKMGKLKQYLENGHFGYLNGILEKWNFGKLDFWIGWLIGFWEF